MAIWNGAIWAIGNGLASTTLIIYLAKGLHASRLGLNVGLILAAPQVVGLLRLAAPAMIGRRGDRKRFCIAAFLGAAMLLALLPWTCMPGLLPSPRWSLATLIALWCLYHLMQYLGTVALWSWLAEVSAVRIRGRFLGWRERWMVAGTAVAAVDAGLFVWGASAVWPLPDWMPYGMLAGLGAVFMMAAVVPLGLAPAIAGSARAMACPGIRSLFAPFRDGRFLRLLLYGCWFSMSNGITQSAQRVFPIQVLRLSLFSSLTLETGTRLGQWTLGPWVGGLADRLGNRRVMIVSQLLVAAGLLGYAAATPDEWLWVAVAAGLWIAYVGLNVCLPNLMLKVSPTEFNTSYIAAFEAIRGLCYAGSTVLGGMLLDWFGSPGSWLTCTRLSMFATIFLAGWAIRSVGAFLLFLVVETPSKQTRR
ncbi:MAG: hypothetical protein LLG00_06110 [Planctomycetaceae bacterium]|nr:hypothetical protein [Planctomycetaceae bacterium]